MLYTPEIATKLREFLETVGEVKATGETYKMVISKQIPDRDRETIMLDGMDAKAYKKNPVVLIDHSYRVESIVGKTVKLYQEGNQLIADFVFADTEKGQLAKQLYEKGFLKTSSIGFIIQERDATDRAIITKWELLEWSLVAVPANPAALSQDGKLMEEAISKGLMLKAETCAKCGCEGCGEGCKETPPETPTPETVITSEEAKAIREELSEIKTILKTLADDKASEKSAVDALKQKELLQTINRATAQALEGLKQLKPTK